MAGRFRSPKSKEEETSLLSELRSHSESTIQYNTIQYNTIQHNTILNGVEKSLRNGSSDSKINVQC